MIIGVGLDVVEVERLAGALDHHGTRFERRVFTDRELQDCGKRADRVLALAARFAAKEACLKALGTGWSQGLGFRQIEVRSSGGVRPEIVLEGRAAEVARALKVATVHVSLTHQPGIAAAVVVLEAAPGSPRKK